MIEDDTYIYTYNVNGNLIQKDEKASLVSWYYTYTVYDELRRVQRLSDRSTGGSTTLNKYYFYDALGRRHAARNLQRFGNLIDGNNWRYDGEHIAHEKLLDSAGDFAQINWYSHSDNVDEPIALTQNAGAGNVSPTATTLGENAPSDASHYYHLDHQNSVRALTDDTGQIVNEYSYSAYGENETAVESVPQPFRYTSREWDKDTGLLHYRARAYDPSTGRFLQEDPIWFAAGDLNVHRYVWNNPVNWVDPSGLSALEAGVMASISTNALLGGTIAGEDEFATGASTAQFMEQEGTNTLSAIAAGINCNLHVLSDALASANQGETVLGENDECGVDTVEEIELAVKDDIKLFKDTLKLACKEKGFTYNRALRRCFHDRITGQGISSFGEMLDEARCFLDEGGN